MGVGDMFKLLSQAGQIRDQMAQMQARAARRTVEGHAGGGLVKVTANGTGEILMVTYDPEALKDAQVLGALTTTAVNDALAKSKEVLSEEMRGTMSALGLPAGLPGL